MAAVDAHLPSRPAESRAPLEAWGGVRGLAVAGAVLLAALALRTWALTEKPPHFDEGINGSFVAGLWYAGFYKYDPTNYHGPLYFYLLQLGEVLLGPGAFGARLVTGLTQLAALALVLSWRRWLGGAAAWGAALLAVSPAFVFYSRYAIHESLFFLAEVLVVHGWLWLQESASRRAALALVLGAAAALATKETASVFLVTLAIAWALTASSQRLRPASLPVEGPPPPDAASLDDWLAVGGVAALALTLLFNGFNANPGGMLDFFTAHAAWARTGTAESGHDKPFGYWLQLLVRYEPPLLLGLLASLPLTVLGTRPQRLLAWLGFGLWLAYSLVPYKTPWCLLSWGWPLALASGVALEGLARTVRAGWAAGLVRLAGLALVAVSLGLSLRLNFRDFVKLDEPYVYTQTTGELGALYRRLEDAAAQAPHLRNARLLVVVRESWPLPWLLAAYPNVAWPKVDDASFEGADVVLADAMDGPRIEAQLRGRYSAYPFTLRGDYQPGMAYLRTSLYGAQLPAGLRQVGRDP
jgi:uncharacterized protein (TIGR03663 family)